LTLWTIDWLKKKNFKLLRNLDTKINNDRSIGNLDSFNLSPLYWAGLIGHPFNTILGIDKLIFGSILGALLLLWVYLEIKSKTNKGKQLFNYQKGGFPDYISNTL